MYYYLVLFLVLASLAIFDSFVCNKRIKNLLLIITYLLLVCTSGLKYETGVDWRAYAEWVDSVMPINQITTPQGYESVFNNIDVGFNLLISVIKYFGGGLQILFLILSSFSSGLLIIALKRYLKYPLLGVIVYFGLIFFYLDMSGIRQATSLCILIYSLKYIHNRQPFKFFLAMTVAFTFHWSILFLLPLYWFANININKWVVVVIVLITAVLYFGKIKWISSLIPSLFLVLQDTNFGNKVVIYSSGALIEKGGINARLIIHLIFLTTIVCLSFLYRKDFTQANKYYPLFHNFLIMQVIIFFAFNEFPDITERVKMYFYISSIVVLPNFLLLAKTSFKKAIYIGFIFSYALFYVYGFLLEKPFSIAYYPYQNYIVYKIFGLQSTGNQRLNEHMANTETP